MTKFSTQNFEGNSLQKFHEVCTKILDKRAPHKSKFVRSNYSRFTKQNLSKAIISIKRLRDAFFKEKSGRKQKEL